jgi:peptidoglycan-N-acetylglucosamine deacetylase
LNSLKEKQVFQTNDSKRWLRFRVTTIAVVSLFVLILGVALFSLKDELSPKLPILEGSIDFKKITDSIQVDDKTHDQFNYDLDKIRKKHLKNFYKKGFLEGAKNKNQGHISYPIRAGFFVNWDVQSLFSLRQNASKMNMVLPEWFFVQDTSDEILVDIEPKALAIMRQNHLAIVPMISNFVNEWKGKNVHRIISNQKRKAKFIQSILNVLDKYHFQGVNIDFEELVEKSDENFNAFIKDISEALHQKGYIVSQDVAPFNDDYNYTELSKYNDLLFLMAYDQHNAGSKYGAVAAQEWVENALDDIIKKVPQEKVVLCIAAFGYDWPDKYLGSTLTYQEAITIAQENESKIDFDNNDYNLNYSYEDDEGILHKVCFTDAGTLFNVMRASADFGTSGVAMWRLGSEDARVWNFYSRNLCIDSLRKYPFNFNSISKVPISDNIDYTGEGEVLNLLSIAQEGDIKIERDTEDMLISEETYLSLPTNFVVQKSGNIAKKIVLTFDDGPDEKYTPEILEILKKYNVPASFFVTGVNAVSNIPLLRKLYNEGYEIGNHTFTHVNLLISSDARIKLELRSTRRLIEAITHHSTILFRPPYDVDAEPTNALDLHPLYIAKQDEYIYVGSSIDPRDWEEGISADTIYQRATDQRVLGNIILMHDAGGNRDETIKALPRIIEFYQKNGYKFVTLADYLGKTKSELMPAVKGGFNTYLLYADNALARITYFQEHMLSWLFYFALILVLFRIFAIAFLVFIRKKKGTSSNLMEHHLVSIIVPAFNEEVNVLKTIETLLKSTHKNIEIVFVDDGSTDNTLDKVKLLFADHPMVKIFTKINGGKASAINYGIENASAEIVVCIDADTQLAHDAISELISDFADSTVASVAGNVKVGNKLNLLTRWQSIEYTTSQNFDRLAFDVVNGIMVVPGAIGAFRKSAVKKVGGFSTDTLAEDCDITLKLLDEGYKVKTNNRAIAYTEVPETVAMFMKQRRRWSFGIMQSFWKHRKKLFGFSKPNLGWAVLPNMLIYQLLLPLFSPLVDIMLLVSLISGKTMLVLVLYFGYMIIDLLISAVAYYIEKKEIPFLKLLLIIPQRIIYRQLLFVVLIQSYLRAIKGELVHWGILKRTGNVSEANK